MGSERLSLRRVLAQAAGFTFLNPHVYLDTVLLMGTVGARQALDGRIAFVGGAACASAVWFTGLGFGARLLAPVFARPKAWRKLGHAGGPDDDYARCATGLAGALALVICESTSSVVSTSPNSMRMFSSVASWAAWLCAAVPSEMNRIR